MEAIDSNETPKRRLEDQTAAQQIDWTKPGAPAVPATPVTTPRAVASLLVNGDGVSVFATEAAKELEHGHYMLWVPGTKPPPASPAAPAETVIPAPLVEDDSDLKFSMRALLLDNTKLNGQKVGDLVDVMLGFVATHIARQVQPTEEAARFERMFMAACADLGLINEELGLDPDDGGAEPIIAAIRALKGSGSTPEGTGNSRGSNE